MTEKSQNFHFHNCPLFQIFALLSFVNTDVYSLHSAIMMILNVISPLIFSYEGNATDDAKTMIIFINFNFLVVKMILATHQGSRRESGQGKV